MADTPRITPNLDAITPGPKSVTGQAQNPPGQQLSAGTVLHGAVSGNDSDGNTIIKTDALRLVLKTDFPLKKGVDITLRLEQSVQPQAEPRVRITHINGQTAQHWQVSQGQTANMARTSLPAGSASGGVILPESTQAGADKSTQPPQPADARGDQGGLHRRSARRIDLERHGDGLAAPKRLFQHRRQRVVAERRPPGHSDRPMKPDHRHQRRVLDKGKPQSHGVACRSPPACSQGAQAN